MLFHYIQKRGQLDKEKKARFVETNAMLVSARKGMLLTLPEFDYNFKIMGQPTAVSPSTFRMQIDEELPLNK